MCYHCKNRVSIDSVTTGLDAFTGLMQSLRMYLSFYMAIAIRVIANLAQSKEWHDAIDDEDHARIDTLRAAAYQQAEDYARDMPAFEPEHYDRKTAMSVERQWLDIFVRANIPISNALCATLKTLSDLILECGRKAPTHDAVEKAIEANVLLFNAEMDFRDGQNGLTH